MRLDLGLYAQNIVQNNSRLKQDSKIVYYFLKNMSLYGNGAREEKKQQNFIRFFERSKYLENEKFFLKLSDIKVYISTFFKKTISILSIYLHKLEYMLDK